MMATTGRSTQQSLRLITRATVFVWLLSVVLTPQPVHGGLSAGYSEYYIPGESEQLWQIFVNLDNDPVLVAAQGMHCVIAVTASTDDTTIYYDHWEDGYGFDPANPATADETYHIDEGDVQEFESSNIPVLPRGTGEYYDGRDRIYVAGGLVSVTRASWPESIGTVFALAWEIYPVRALNSAYTIPVGQDLFSPPASYADFERVYVIAQSTSDGNTVQIDDPAASGVERSVTLNRGEVTQLYSIHTGTIVSATASVQVQFIVGRQSLPTNNSEVRGYSAVPDDLWNTEYYNPVGGFAPGTNGGVPYGQTDLYLYNPHATAITISYEDSDGSGSFVIPANSTLSYTDGAMRSVPQGSGVYLHSAAEFWGIGSADAESYSFDWGYSLVPAYALTTEYFLGWAPGSSEVIPTVNGSPVFVTPVQDDTTVYVDFGPTDGVVDLTYTLNRLDSQRIFDPDNENSGMHIWATGPIAVAWGEDSDAARANTPYLDLGYTTLPPRDDWMDLVLGLEKTVDPTAVSEGPDNVVTVTLSIPTFAFLVSDVVVTDTLFPQWEYVPDSTTVTWPNGTTRTDAAANPTVSGVVTTGQELVWGASVLPPTMNPTERLTITFQARTTINTPGGYNINEAQVTGTRPGTNETFTAYDEAYVYISSLTIDKDTTTPLVRVGDVATYTIAVNSSEVVLGAVISDVLPAGFTYLDSSIAGSGVTRTNTSEPNVGDSALAWGTWDIGVGGTLVITLSAEVNAAPGTYDNTAVIYSPRTGAIDDAGTAAQDAGTPSGLDPEPDEDVTVIQPTAVQLLYLRATPQPGSVLLAWETAVEVDNYGFRLLRGTSGNLGDAQEIVFVPAAGHGSGGGVYSFGDRSAQSGSRYAYWLVDVDTGGRSAVHGPVFVTAMPQADLVYRLYLPVVVR
jgi:uncharacterized repeat protein (TIGR01451 family)